MTDGQVLWLYVFGGLAVSLFLALLVGRFLKAGHPTPPDVVELDVLLVEREHAEHPS